MKKTVISITPKFPFFTIWGDSDSAVVYNDFKEKLNKIMPKKERILYI